MALTEEQDIIADAVLNVLTTVVSFIFLGLYILGFFRMKAKATDPTSKLYLRYVMSCSLIFIISYTIRYLFKTCTHDAWTFNKSDKFNAIDDVIGDVFFVIGHGVFYLIMILRLFFVFRGSKYALSRTVILALALCWSMIVLVDAAYFIVLRNVSEATQQIALHFLILVILDIMLGTMLIVIFTRKLLRMGLDSTENARTMSSNNHEQQHVQHDDDDSDIGDDHVHAGGSGGRTSVIQLTQTQRILVSAAGRFVVLCGMTILFINVQFLCQALYILSSGPKYGTFTIVLAVWYMVVLIIEYYTIYLSFPTTTNQYEVVCGLLDGCVTGMVRAQMLSKLQRQRAEQNGELRHFCCCCVLQRDHFADQDGVDV